MADGDVEELGLSGDEKIVALAKERFQRCVDWESSARARFQQDLKFANADPDNGYQWPNYLWAQRKDDPNGYKPRLTINKVRVHNLQIKNDARQNKPGIKISPVSNDATFKASEVWQSLIRDIERKSKATQAYQTATNFQVDAGIGYLRVVTDYASDDSFDQELYIRGVQNPLNVYMDPDCKEPDYSDARFGFVFDNVPRGEFLNEYPELKDEIAQSALGNTGAWLDGDHVRVAEYYVRTMKKDKLVLMKDPYAESGNIIVRWSKVPKELKDLIDDDTILQEREIFDSRIMWYKIASDKIIERRKVPGRYIPIVPVIGEQTIIDNVLDRKGNTRNLKDAQRMYNFWSSSAVEQVALQTKSRWFIPVGSTENLESYYATLNTQNYPFIPYNALDTEGNALPPPTPIDPPQMAEGFIKGMLITQNEMGMASGQREENFGERGQTISGKAIGKRSAAGDNSTYHFIDGLAIAIRQIGNIILDVAPYVYDTEQIRRILNEDGTEQEITLDPNAKEAYSEEVASGETAAKIIFNPTIGRYWVEADVGPSYATRRQEAWDAFVQIITANNELISVAGDILFSNADFPGADQMAKRLRRLIKPEVLGEGPDAQLMAAQEQMKQLQSLIAEMTEKLAQKDLQLRDKAADERVDSFRADSDRLKQLDNAKTSMPDDMQPLIDKTIRSILSEQGMATGEKPEVKEQPEEADPDAPVPGARKGADGNYYVPNPKEPGKFMMVELG